MDSIQPRNFEERVVWYSITGTYIFYVFGALYPLAPAIAWVLLFYLLLKWYFQTEDTPKADRVHVPIAIWIWIIGMLVMEVALIMGHLNWELGTGKLIKSSVGWAKGWALIAIFPLLGASLDIRPELIYRAGVIVCYHTVVLIPLFIGAAILHLPQILYVSPLAPLGPGPDFFVVTLYSQTYDGVLRWRFFAPWGPAIGFVANIYFLFVLQQDRRRKWFWYGLAGCLTMIFMSKSRLAFVSMLSVPIIVWGLSNLTRPLIHFLMAFACYSLGMLAAQLIDLIDVVIARFKGARADSSRVRSDLGKIAVQRWRDEAPIWGHGVVEPGPHLVEHMPIGSHHCWYGLLFVKGIVGFIALLVPMVWSFVELLLKAQTSKVAEVGLAMILILFLYTFGENLEILSYLFWPGLVIIGIAHKQPLRNPFKI
ncbi:capsular biosynthesis protein [Candidatus Thiomargarita nelsonii]|uniref:Capsular biosynthesis protein n=1 Tax=Candidatus Thiomargarita nelsonii TaxID=1003181 RepID=A0A0A6RUJ6_9GAMM|nr:capsular biosynthesis protein [Candidatus Thiomargarita nelsonii]